MDRNRAVLILIISHLTEYGYVEAAATLEREGGAPLSRFEAADNVDLINIVKEYEEYYEMKLGKKPKLVRKTDPDAVKETKTRRRPTAKTAASSSSGEKAAKADGLTQAQTEKYMAAAANAGVASQQLRGMETKLGVAPSNGGLPPPQGPGSIESSGGGGGQGFDGGLTGSAMRVVDRREEKKPPPAESIEDRLLKPLPFANDPDLRALAQTITRDIFQSNPGVNWDDGKV
jgi:katanin p60 ATPase-containing subunit A1